MMRGTGSEKSAVDAIAAISTAYGESGIGIVRLSGAASADLLLQLFRTKSGKALAREELVHRQMLYGCIVDPVDGSRLDEVLVVFMQGPATYTGEDMAEIQAHGNSLALGRILAAVLAAGATAAQPGEFTKLAFLNGRLDLTQAEGVIDLIKARTGKSFDAALDQVEGRLSRQIRHIASAIKELLAFIVVQLDYPGEDLEELTEKQVLDRLSQIGDDLDTLLAFSREGRWIREGLAVVITGKPNVGKSSLLNFLLKENRAIVTEFPGTTRDTIQEQISLAGLPIVLTDTAGIRPSDDPVEQLGVARSKRAFNEADLLLLLLDGSRPLDEEDEALIHMLEERPCIVLINKSDLPLVVSEEAVQSRLPQAQILTTSLTEELGLDEVEQALIAWITGGKVRKEEDALVTNVRHIHLLERAREDIDDAIFFVESEQGIDFAEESLRAAYYSLGEITGERVEADLLEEIFSNFCIGK